jgi:cell division protein FtsN
LKTSLLVIFAGWLLFFMAGTVSHLFQSDLAEKKNQPVVAQLAKPFTIQVAAYLKQSFADRYVQELTEKGLDARVKKVKGGGKTWYVVQVSQFKDKKSAAAFGSTLKQQKIIDDYFVNNN